MKESCKKSYQPQSRTFEEDNNYPNGAHCPSESTILKKKIYCASLATGVL